MFNQTKKNSYDQLRPVSPPIEQPTTQELVPALPDCANFGPQLQTFYLHKQTESLANITHKVKTLWTQGSKLEIFYIIQRFYV